MDAAQIVDRKPNSKRFIDMTGRKFGKLTVESFAGFQGRFAKWKCACQCGGAVVVFGNLLRQGRAQHCGCDAAFDGRSRHPLFQTWNGILTRCFNPASKPYRFYGGRGITMCDEWKRDFWAFATYMGEKPSRAHSVGRIDNDGNYEPGNVRWETHAEQGANSRKVRYITFNNETKSMSEWARGLGVTTECLRLRLKKSASLEAILTTPRGEEVVCGPQTRKQQVELTDDAFEPFPLAMGVVHHVIVDDHDPHEIVELLRTMATIQKWKFKSRVLGRHVLFSMQEDQQ